MCATWEEKKKASVGEFAVDKGSYTGFAPHVAEGWCTPVRFPVYAALRVRRAVGHPGLLSGQSWPKRSPGGSAADADARWRHGDFSSAHDSSRPNWTAAHADRRSHSHGRRGRRIRINKEDRKSTRLNSSHPSISYAVFCLKKKTSWVTTQRRSTRY